MVTRLDSESAAELIDFGENLAQKQSRDATAAVERFRAVSEERGLACAVESAEQMVLTTALQASVDITDVCRSAGVTPAQGQALIAELFGLPMPRLAAVMQAVADRQGQVKGTRR